LFTILSKMDWAAIAYGVAFCVVVNVLVELFCGSRPVALPPAPNPQDPLVAWYRNELEPLCQRRGFTSSIATWNHHFQVSVWRIADTALVGFTWTHDDELGWCTPEFRSSGALYRPHGVQPFVRLFRKYVQVYREGCGRCDKCMNRLLDGLDEMWKVAVAAHNQ
jgi:hypothetical protein